MVDGNVYRLVIPAEKIVAEALKVLEEALRSQK